MNELDEDLRELFDRQREADRTHMPGYEAMRARARAEIPEPQPIARWRWGLSTAAALGLLIATLLWPVPAPTPRPEPMSYDALAHELDQAQSSLNNRLLAQSQVTTWQSPTDFLLHSHL